ncbi:unnamed protein product [Litomosoides sigmodontis]|uniref:ATP-dependent RNA helicase n=1 Tax=Litomosoides sigmodontis TaxID=42156 RepID=A0A3P6T3P8_LITSI|nr:unnamed protein product [Litomosoides sigmodontis]
MDKEQAIQRLLKFEDVIVQAPTGSGKTLAYILPLFTILWKKKKVWPANEIGAVIIVPSRELAKQVGAVCRLFADALSLSMCVMIGGKKGKAGSKAVESLNAAVIIATPGRLQSLISSSSDFKKALKALEILIVDEADRYTDSSFKASMTEILEALPKQRRTGLFSATQAKEMEEIVKFGLRNPTQITITNSGAILDSVDTVEAISPATLNNFYMVVKADQKLYLLVEFIRNHPKSKMLIFFSTCQCVEYMQIILKSLIQKRQIFALHGKKKKAENQLKNFRRTGKSLMLCTDVLSRGIDVDNIDWVVQFDVPKQTSWFVHRAGRSARCGKVGNNVLFLTPEETAYIEFIEKYEKVSLVEMEANLKENDGEAEQIRQHIVEMASKEREILESGTRAFMSFVESYVRHDCNVVCSFKDLDVTGYGHAYGLLRLPRMKEFHYSDLSEFKRSELNTSEIPYKNVEKEKQRQDKLLLLRTEDKSVKKAGRAKKERSDIRQTFKKSAKKRRHSETKENDDLGSNFSLLKKLKKGRLKKREYDELMTDSFC